MGEGSLRRMNGRCAVRSHVVGAWSNGRTLGDHGPQGHGEAESEGVPMRGLETDRPTTSRELDLFQRERWV